MAEDMVASLTLRLQNQLSGGLDEIKGQFNALSGTLDGLNETMGELRDVMADMRGPTRMAADLKAVQTQAAEAGAAISGDIGGAIDDGISAMEKFVAEMGTIPNVADEMAGGVIRSWQAIGVEIEADIASMETFATETQAAMTAMADAQAAKPGVGGPAVPVEPGGQAGATKKAAEKHGSIWGENWIMDMVALGAGYEGEESYAKFQATALQAANIEGFHGKPALAEARNIMHESYNQAYLSRGNVDDIEEAYFNLVRQGLPRPLVDQMMGPLTEAATTYGTPVADITQPLFNLAEQFKIPGDQLSQGVAMLGAASHLGHYYFSDFGTGLPEVAAQFQLMGATGLSGEATAASALEVVRRVTPDSGTAGTDVMDLMDYMTSPSADRFFDRTQRSKDLLGKPILDLLAKYHVQPLDIPQYLDSERAKGVDPLNAMVDYMHSIWRPEMSPTDERFIFGSLFHNQEAGRAMTGLVENYDLFHQDQKKLSQVSPGFLDENFQTAIQGDASGMSNWNLLGTYLNRLYGQNTFGLFAHNGSTPSQADANALLRGSSAFNIPIAITVNVDKSGNVTGSAKAGAPGALAPGVSVKVNSGQVLGRK